jgi:glycerol kinase
MTENGQQQASIEVFEDALRPRDGGDGGALPLVGAIDQGTSSTRFMAFTPGGRVAAVAQVEHGQIYPDGHPGWHEHDPVEIWDNVALLMRSVGRALEPHLGKGKHPGDSRAKLTLSAIGITNQRETTVAWNKATGACYYNAIVWDDTRTTGIAAQLADGNIHRLARKTGLPLASYFAGTKVRWLLDNVDALRLDLADPSTRDQVCFGTIDSWLLYQLTGSHSALRGAARRSTVANIGGVHRTDVTNASRWLFLDLETCRWDTTLIDYVCFPHSLPVSALPEICPSSHVFGAVNPSCGVDHSWFDNVPIGESQGNQSIVGSN